MKIKIIFAMLLAATFISATVIERRKYNLSKDYSVSIHGTSNLHSWDESVEIVLGDAVVNWNDDGSFDIAAVNIKMNVLSIKSDMGSIMNSNTYKALKADQNPEVFFKLTIPVKSTPAGSKEWKVAAKGNLTIAGVTKSVDVNVKISVRENGILAIEGLQTIKMSDYSIDPPTALFGTLKTGDEITINFKVNLISINNTINNS